MKKLTWFIVFLFPLLTKAQELLWENKVRLSNFDYFSSVIKTNEGNYLASGSSSKWKISIPNGLLIGAIIMKFDENGDTLWTKFSGYYGAIYQMIQMDNGLIYSLIGYYDFSTNTPRNYGVLVFNEDGEIQNFFPLAGQNISGVFSMKIKDGNIWIAGERNPSIFFPGTLTFDFLLIKLRMDGTEVFSFVYNAIDQTSRGKKIEFMPNGNILFSGAVGNKIGAFEIDTAGNQIQYRTYFTNNFNSGWESPDVTQMADGNRMVAGTRNTSPQSYYVGKHDTSGARIWGGIKTGGLLKIATNQDSSVILAIANRQTGDKLFRLRADSTVLWETDYSATPLGGFKGLDDLLYEPDQSAVIVGYYRAVANGHQNLYIAKFGGFGIPFDPTSAKAFENLKTDAQPIPFPNPGKDVVKFTILAGPGKVSFTDMKGRKVIEGEYLPEKGISTKALPAGIYNYKLERNGKVWSGKWVKE